jgi:hypothetical protein
MMKGSSKIGAIGNNPIPATTVASNERMTNGHADV